MNNIPITIDSRIRIPIALLSDSAIAALKSEFTHDNPDFAREERLSKARGWKRRIDPTMATWAEEGGDLTLPRGKFARIREVLSERGCDFGVSDRRTEGDPALRHDGRYKLAPHIVPAPFQIEARDKAAEVQNCLLRAPTGSGKSVFGEMIASALGLPTVVLVQTDELFKQWVRRLHTELGVPQNEIGQIKGKVHKIKPITVASVQTFAKHVNKYNRTFGVVIFDEVQRAAANTFYPAVDGLDAKYRIGISAEEKRKDRKEFLIYDLFGKVALEVDRKRLIDDGFILDTEVRLVPTEFEAPWYTKLSSFQRQSEQVFNKLLAEMTKDERRNELAVKLTVEEMKAGHVSLVFSHRVEHCFDIRARIVERDHRVGIIVGEPKYKQESNESLQQIVTGQIIAAVGTVQSIGTGIDIPAAARGIATTPMHSNRQQAGQMRGRLCRVDRQALDIQLAGRLRRTPKTDSILYVLWDRKVHGLVPLRQWLRINDGNVTVYDPETGKTEPGRAFLKRAEREESEML
jgi:superfamily II DNA or RNA helicase